MNSFNRIFDGDSNTFLGIAEPPSPNAGQRKPRSAAQIAASRINGAKSRGPKTARGKARSQLNAVRHGILARKIIPLADERHEHREYCHLLEGLVEEFEPCTTTQWAWVEAMAHDLVQLGRIKQLQDVVMTTAPIKSHYSNGGTCTIDLGREIEVLQQLLVQLRSGQQPRCLEADATRLAASLISRLEELQENAAEVKEFVEEGDEVDDESLEMASLHSRIDSDGSFLGDRTSFPAMLTGRELIRPEHRQRWTLLIEDWLSLQQQALKGATFCESEFNKQYRKQQAELLERLPSMEVLMRYEVQFRRSIERTTRLLLERKASR